MTDLYDYLPAPWRPAIPRGPVDAVDAFLRAETAAGREWHPAPERVFHALSFFPPEDTRVVICGQDPYPRAGQPTGLAFSLPPGEMSPSARNIVSELAADIGGPTPAGADLSPWAEQGVLLWNSAATTRIGHAGAHARSGWHVVTDAVVRALAERAVFLCWGAHAQRLATAHVDPAWVVASNHPSPLSARRGPRPFIGSRPFSAVNDLLARRGMTPVRWELGDS